MTPIRIHLERWNDLVIIRLRPNAKRQMQICREYGDKLVGRKLAKGEKVTGYISFKEQL